MALFNFGKKKKIEEKAKPRTAAPPSEAKSVRKLSVVSKTAAETKRQSGTARRTPVAAATVLLSPRVSEKASDLAGSHVYAFNVSPRAGKREIAAAIHELYGFVPRKVSVVNIPAKQVFVRGRVGRRPGGKKAYVYLKEGETIEIA